MKFISRCLLSLLAASSICRGSNWYVSPSGSGNGSLASPWSLQTAITSSSVKPGDTVWLRSGVYTPTATFPSYENNVQGWAPSVSGSAGNSITYSSYSNEWAAIDREWMLTGCHNLCFSNLEFYDSLKGHNLTNTAYPQGPWVHFPMAAQPGFQWVNCVIHDVDDCWGGGVLYQVRGCILWYVGWNILEHECYPAPTNYSGNISGWHLQSVMNFNTTDMVCISNIFFGGGDTVPNPVNANSDILGGGYNETISYNYFYNRLTTAVTAECLNLQSSPAGSMVIHNNVIVGPIPVSFAGGGNVYGTVDFQHNTVYASSANYSSPLVFWLGTGGTWAFNYNSYFSTTPNPVTFDIRGSYGNSLAQWQSSQGFDANSTAASGTTPPASVNIVPNQDQPKRANVAIYNWSKANNVTVNLAGVLNAGDSYSLYSAQNYKAGAIQSGTYNGTSISVPMTNLTTAPILYGGNMSCDGVQIVQPPPTSPEFGAFVVIGSGTSVAKSSPTLTWTTPAAITYGAALSSSQLNATANVPGTFAYAPSAGTVLNKGTSVISVIFTPTDTVNYNSATGSVNLVVSAAALSAAANNATSVAGAALPVFTGTLAGLLNKDNITANYSCSATINSPAGTYAIVPSLVDPGSRLTNYSVSLINGTLTITPVTTPMPPTDLRIMPQ